ncbi:MAG TPA: PQQ-binding-like beta-propeller repeat protein [Solirubrobacteraceae bacterium]|jgi:outer membrane protein assembly factor BamB
MSRSSIPRALTAACAVLLVACGGHAVGRSHSKSNSSSTAASSTSPAPARRASTAAVKGDWLRFDFNAQRSGVGPASTGITSHNLGQLRLQKVSVNGTVDSSAILLHAVSVGGHARDVAIMTTTYGRTFALDATTGARLWEFTPADIHDYEGSAQITTATPIADPDRRFVYAASPDGRIHKLRVANGHEIRAGGWPTRVTLDPTHEKIASALNISGGSVLVTTGGYIGDVPPYQGHVVTISRATGRITGEWNSLCSDRHQLIKPSTCSASDSAIWGRAGAVVEPGTGRILVTTGNALFNGSTNWGDSVLELSASGRSLLHNWTPANQVQLNSSDGDLGSTSPAVLPKTHGFRLAVQGGKDGVLRLLNLNRLDGTTGGAGSRLGGELQRIPTPGSGPVFTAPAVWTHHGDIYVFLADTSGTTAYVLGGKQPRLHVAWTDSASGTSPIVAGGLLYVFDPEGSLVVYSPTTGHKLISLPAGSGHWNSPIAVGGRVILPVGNANDHATSGTVDIYHLPGH